MLYSHAEIQCLDLSTPHHGTKSSEKTKTQTIVTFRCDSGYELYGNAAVECLENGLWKGSVPDCKGMSCTVTDVAVFCWHFTEMKIMRIELE